MNNASKFLALAFSALAFASGAAQAHEGSYPEVKPFQSTLSRAEVQAQAKQVNASANGEVGAYGVQAPAASTALTRAEVRSEVLAAAKAHKLHNGEASL